MSPSLSRQRTGLVVNCSPPHYNMGARKLVDWLKSDGWAVDYFDGDPGLLAVDVDRICLSVIFSWHAPLAREIALRWRDRAEVWCGGPGMAMLGGWWTRETGLTAARALDPRFERQRGDYLMTFASRGCPVGCYFCIVPRIEGKQFTLDWDFQPAPILCDNNLSALPVEFQDHIIQRYQQGNMTLKDANSGFEPQTFDAGTYRRWSALLRGPWRFAYDELGETQVVKAMALLLKDVSPRRKQVYVLCGNEPISACYERAVKVIEWGCEPFCQFLKPLSWLGDPRQLRCRHDWTYQRGRDFCRYFNRHLWRSVPLEDYRDRKGEAPPFGFLAQARP